MKIEKHTYGYFVAGLTIALISMMFFSTYDEAVQKSTVDQSYPRIEPREAEKLVNRGFALLVNREPEELIRGMLDISNPDYGLETFEKAAWNREKYNDPRAQFILGWISQSGYPRELSKENLSSPALHDLEGLHMMESKAVAAKWYLLASNQGLAKASTKLGWLLRSWCDNENGLSNKFFEKGSNQGDLDANVALARSYAYGENVAADSTKAWSLLEQLIYGSDRTEAIYATSTAVDLWNNAKINPPKKFTKGSPNAVEYVKQLDPSIDKYFLDYLYSYSGFTPDPMPSLRWRFAVRIFDYLAKDDNANKKLPPTYSHFSKSGEGITTKLEDGWAGK